MNILEFTKEILAIDSPTGYTKNVVNFLKERAEAYGYKTEVTPKGNLHVFVDGKDNSRRVGISAHCDTLGAMVRSITPEGNLKFTKIGGLQLPTVDGEYCNIYTRDGRKYTGTILSSSPSSHVYKDAESKERNEDNMIVRLDEKVENKEDVLDLGIQNGDFICVDPKTTITNGFIKSRFLDDKLSVGILFKLLDSFRENKPAYDMVFVFSTYEEVGHGSSYIPEMDEFLACDMGCIGEDLSCTEYDVSICAKDSSGPYDYDMVTRLLNIAKEKELPHAIDIYPMYGSDVSAALRAGNNIKGALVGPGVHASHGMERSTESAANAAYELLFAYLTN